MEFLKYIAVWLLVIAVIWSGGVFFADKVSDYEVITPAENVECVVVSRMFNTSVACWKDE